MRYADTVPVKDKQKILDMYYGRGEFSGARIVETIDEMERILKGKYTKAQITAIIYADVDDKGGDL